MSDHKYPPLALRIPLPAPLAVFLEFTNRCNFKCSFCPESLDDYTQQAGGLHRISWNILKKACEGLADLGGVKVLRFYGLGETLLHPEAIEMISFSCGYGIAEHTDITTNGSMLTPERSSGLIASGIDCVRVSIYGTTAEEMHGFTKSPFTPERIRENMRNFLALRGERTKPILYAKIVADDPFAIARFRAMYEDAADALEITPLHNWTGQNHLTQISRPTTKMACPSPFYQIKINSDGIVTCCATDWRKDTAVGSVAEESLKDIWNGGRMKAFRIMHLEHKRCENAACANCDFLNVFPDNIDHLTPEVLA
jgi:radical SAM protein with 4Fe4S-binding SPASM domain